MTFTRRGLVARARRRLGPPRITATPREIRDRQRYGETASDSSTIDPLRARLAAATRKALGR